MMGSCNKSLLLFALLALCVSAETDFCKAERRKCEGRCRGLGMNFDCDDKNGARSVACSCGSDGGIRHSSARSAVSVRLVVLQELLIRH